VGLKKPLQAVSTSKSAELFGVKKPAKRFAAKQPRATHPVEKAPRELPFQAALVNDITNYLNGESPYMKLVLNPKETTPTEQASNPKSPESDTADRIAEKRIRRGPKSHIIVWSIDEIKDESSKGSESINFSRPPLSGSNTASLIQPYTGNEILSPFNHGAIDKHTSTPTKDLAAIVKTVEAGKSGDKQSKEHASASMQDFAPIVKSEEAGRFGEKQGEVHTSTPTKDLDAIGQREKAGQSGDKRSRSDEVAKSGEKKGKAHTSIPTKDLATIFRREEAAESGEKQSSTESTFWETHAGSVWKLAESKSPDETSRPSKR